MKTQRLHLSLTAAAAALTSSLSPAPAATVTLDATADHASLHTSGGSAVIQVQVAAKKEPPTKRTIPLNLAVVLDRSGSMSGDKIEKARQAACVALDEIAEGDTFSLIIYSNDAEVLIPAGPVKDKAALEAKIMSIQARGSTALHAGVVTGADQLRKHFAKDKINRVILLSDGLANVGPSTTSDLAKLGSQLSGDGISVTTIGLGDDYNEDLMTALAESSEANYYYVKDAEKLPDVFAEELGTIKTIAARDLRIIITLPEGIRGTGILGEESIEFNGGTLTIPLAQLSGGHSRRFLVGIEVPAGEEDHLKLAAVRLEYADPSGTSQSAEATVTASRTADQAAASASIRAEVGANVAVARNRIVKEQAVALSDAGKPAEAAKLLKRQMEENAALPAAMQNDILLSEQDSLATRASELEATGGLSPASRKLIQYENYQDKKQKR